VIKNRLLYWISIFISNGFIYLLLDKMEKLIELVYYYNSHLEKGKIWIWLTTSVKENGREVSFDKEKEIRKYESYIISKKYGFIERLVENDKINKELIKRVLIRAYITSTEQFWLKCEFYDYYESLLMILSIQDNPIEYLCSILKE
jgi:hypothetical protein